MCPKNTTIKRQNNKQDCFHHYALDANKNIIYIEHVRKENRRNEYRCISCGDEMIPVLGEYRKYHFRHKNTKCKYESYIHKIWKQHIKDLWEKQEPFIVGYLCTNDCFRRKTCIVKKKLQQPPCNKTNYIKEFDLKKKYDTCEIEKCYNGFRADIMLSNSKHPKLIKPTFIEINYKHGCTEEKKDSGIAIIELIVFDDKQDNFSLLEKKNPNVTFYGVKRLWDYCNKQAHCQSLFQTQDTSATCP